MGAGQGGAGQGGAGQGGGQGSGQGGAGQGGAGPGGGQGGAGPSGGQPPVRQQSFSYSTQVSSSFHLQHQMLALDTTKLKPLL